MRIGLRTTILVLWAVWAIPAASGAQIIQSVNRFTNGSESEARNIRAAALGESVEPKGANLLPQANADVGGDTPTIGLQAMDLWMAKQLRMYARLTLPVKPEPVSKSGSSDSGSSDTEE